MEQHYRATPASENQFLIYDSLAEYLGQLHYCILATQLDSVVRPSSELRWYRLREGGTMRMEFFPGTNRSSMGLLDGHVHISLYDAAPGLDLELITGVLAKCATPVESLEQRL